MKREWKKEEKNLYLPKSKPQLVTVPKQNFFMIKGVGDPNEEDFSLRVGALYALSYGVKMMPKSGVIPKGYYEYTIYPLEGVWDLVDYTKGFDKMDKSNLLYTIMIRQPDFVDDELFREVLKNAKKKKANPVLDDVFFGSMEDGVSLQIMHVGYYDDEPESFKVMDEYCVANGLERIEKIHREIYLGDPRKADPSKLKTVLRYKVGNNSKNV